MKMIYFQRNSIFTLLFIFFAVVAQAQRDIPPKPSEETSVYDQAEVLTQAEEQNLERKLVNYADSTSTQIVIATINSLQGEYPGTYLTEWAHEWGIGQADKDNGILILMTEEEKKIWISTGYGIEGYLTDALSKQIVEQVILPEFRNGNYYKGLDEGTTAVMQVLNGVYENTGTPTNNTGAGPRFVIIAIIFIVMMVIFSRGRKGGGKNDGRRGAGGSFLDILILSSLGRGAFGGGSMGGGGGFGGGFGGGGFGGGGFGGGGAGGGW